MFDYISFVQKNDIKLLTKFKFNILYQRKYRYLYKTKQKQITMKKMIYLAVLCLVLGVTASSCKKEETEPTLSLPTVTTEDIFYITGRGAFCGGTISDEGGSPVTARGVCWSTSANPTTADAKTSNGTGIGTFSSTLSGFVTGNVYYVRAYATNSDGTAYGNQRTTTAP